MYFLLWFCIDAKKTLGFQNNNSLENIEVAESLPGIIEDDNLEHRNTSNNWVNLRKCICLYPKSTLENSRKHKIIEAYIS